MGLFGGGKHDHGSSEAADESNRLMQEQLDRERKLARLKLKSLQQYEYSILSAPAEGGFTAHKPTQADYPLANETGDNDYGHDHYNEDPYTGDHPYNPYDPHDNPYVNPYGKYSKPPSEVNPSYPT